jgi:aminoglycoside phosphotransferase (APT) family kinase protein
MNMAIEPDFEPEQLENLLGGGIELQPVASGQSNPTWFVTCGARRLVLRKKPKGATLSSAHAVDREYRVMAALANSGVPVPEMVMFEEDSSILGTPFYLMERLEGYVSADSALPDLNPPTRRTIYSDAARILAQLHQFDWRAAGLTDFGKSSGYYTRQVRRWARQWEATKTRDDARIDALSDWFAHNIPRENATTIVHGDYRIGNLMYAPDASGIVGVLDWELSTLGDPLADLAHWTMFWELGPDQLGGLASLNLIELGIPSRSEFLDIYRRAGGCDAPLTPFHKAFALYRMSVIFEGITARAHAGQAASNDALAVGALAPIFAEFAEKILTSDAIKNRTGGSHEL